jgi:cytoskeletal protein RodZ
VLDLGDTLREARERRGLTLKDAEDSLKIRSKYLQALEQNDFEVIPGPTFVRAFMRTYAAFLGLDTERLMEEYSSQFEPQTQDKRALHTRGGSSRARDRGPHRQPNYVVVGIVAVAIIVVLALVFRSRGNEPAVLDPAAVVTTTTAAAGTEFVTTAKPSRGTTTTRKGTATTVAAADVSPSAGPSQGGSSASTVAAAGVSDGVLNLVVRASGRCFVTVRQESPTGKTLFSGTLKKGDKLSYSYSGQYYLNIGVPSAVELLLNGQPVEVPEPYGQFVLSRAGLERL